jgi:hypothetical protein
MNLVDIDSVPRGSQCGVKPGRPSLEKMKISMSAAAGLTFAVAPSHRKCKEMFHDFDHEIKAISPSACCYITGALEYITRKMLKICISCDLRKRM